MMRIFRVLAIAQIPAASTMGTAHHAPYPFGGTLTGVSIRYESLRMNVAADPPNPISMIEKTKMMIPMIRSCSFPLTSSASGGPRLKGSLGSS